MRRGLSVRFQLGMRVLILVIIVVPFLVLWLLRGGVVGVKVGSFPSSL